MRYGSIPTVSERVSRVVLGSIVFSTENHALTNELLDRFVAAGGTAVDTARIYGRGTSEVAFGQWVMDRGCRDQLVVIGKGAHHDSVTYEPRVTPAAIHEDIEASLRAIMPVFAWSAQARGFFGGSYSPGMIGETQPSRTSSARISARQIGSATAGPKSLPRVRAAACRRSRSPGCYTNH